MRTRRLRLTDTAIRRYAERYAPTLGPEDARAALAELADRSVETKYPARRGARIHVVDGIALVVRQGSIITVLPPGAIDERAAERPSAQHLEEHHDDVAAGRAMVEADRAPRVADVPPPAQTDPKEIDRLRNARVLIDRWLAGEAAPRDRAIDKACSILGIQRPERRSA